MNFVPRLAENLSIRCHQLFEHPLGHHRMTRNAHYHRHSAHRGPGAGLTAAARSKEGQAGDDGVQAAHISPTVIERRFSL
jgi:hypothetical protein